MIQVVEDIIDDYDLLRQHCDGLDYSGEKNPADGVIYPGISSNVPCCVSEELASKASGILGVDINVSYCFLRLTVKGQKVPHSAHNDALMGDYGLIVYLNKRRDCAGGTSFVRHNRLGMESGPKTAEQEAAWQNDTNNYDAWTAYKSVKMKQNRGFIFDTSLMHRAELPNNFGSCALDGRLALIMFFKVA